MDLSIRQGDPVTCCTHCQAAREHFGPAAAEADLERYGKRGPDKTTRHLIAALRAAGLRNASLLDIGAGVGVIHHELLGEVVGSATHVEAAPAYLGAARAESARRGNGDRVRFVEGDFVDLADSLDSADVVTLDRVICCYPDYTSLVTRSAAKAERYYAFSVPRDRWYVRAVGALGNLVRRLRGEAFRTYVHPTRAIDALLRNLGFSAHARRASIAWETSVYVRQEEAATA